MENVFTASLDQGSKVDSLDTGSEWLCVLYWSMMGRTVWLKMAGELARAEELERSSPQEAMDLLSSVGMTF